MSWGFRVSGVRGLRSLRAGGLALSKNPGLKDASIPSLTHKHTHMQTLHPEGASLTGQASWQDAHVRFPRVSVVGLNSIPTVRAVGVLKLMAA